ncbi:S8 family serine peptidase [Gallaecimonas sp. GXIMD4217]|uniref:S8 family serine peptidase n=1 Tax=Gallaecimonas sp. GXIMD4217 TaxID=3131927 RepID=UPI00311B3B55
MFRLTLLASLIASSALAAGEDGSRYQAEPLPTLPAHALKQRQRDISDLYFVHFHGAPLAVAARDLQQQGLSSLRRAGGRLNVRAPASQQYLARLDQQRQAARQRLGQALGRSLRFEQEYGTVINAATVRLSKAEAKRLARHRDVQLVEQVQPHQLHTDSGPGFIGADRIWQGLGESLPSKGEGVVVGIIDTGIDADHPSFAATASDGYQHVNPLGDGAYLGDCLQHDWLCNDKLIGVVSYPELRDLYPATAVDGFERPEIIDTGWDMHGHGTHVAATAAGNPLADLPMYNVIGDPAQFRMPAISGVAPRANIVSYQVCLPLSDDPGYGGCYPDLTIKALEHAIANGVDVINYSVGGGASSPWQSTDALAFLNARVAGLHVATSAGNAGPGPQTVGSPGNAPWITTVAAYSHDRGYADKQLTAFTGGDNPPAPLTGKGATDGYSGPVVDAADFGDGHCNAPFPQDTFSGQIVVCRRGDIARVEKGANVLAGGAGAMVLINMATDADNLVADLHTLPAIQLSKADGETLLAWLASGEGHQATIEGTEQIRDPGLGDIAGYFTSRGPGLPHPGVLVPDLAAPGVDIFAAHTTEWPFSETQPNAYAFMSGTSMASPHVAGALALLTALHPDWTPAQVQSALMSTAKASTFTDDDGDGVKDDSTPFDAGTGRIQLAEAARAGLLLDISEADYLAADPDQGGDPTALNLPSLVGLDCVLSCTWTRTVTAVQDGSWRASFDYQDSGFTLAVSPAQFSLEVGQSQELTITATANAELAADWVFGRVLLSSDGLPGQHLSAAVNFIGGTTPAEDEAPVLIQAHRDADRHTLGGFTSVGSDELQVTAYGLSKVNRHQGQTSWDPDAPYLSANPETYQTVAISANADTKLLSVWLDSAEAPDLDLYIVRDADLDGAPSMLEIHNAACVSGRADSAESCVLDDPAPGSYLAVVHNYQGTAEGNLDSHSLSVARVDSGQQGFSVLVPTAVATGEAFEVTLQWQQEMTEGESYYGGFSLGTHPDLPDNIGTLYFELARGEDDVTFGVDRDQAKAGETIGYQIELMANAGAEDRHYHLTATLPEGFSVQSADGAEINGNQLSWTVTQAAGADGRTLSLAVNTDQVVTDSELALELSHSVNGAPAVASEAPGVLVLGRPQALINGEQAPSLSVQSPASLTLTAEVGQGAGDILSYQWQQLSGPALGLSGTDAAALSVAVPQLQSDAVAEIQLLVTTSKGTSLPVLATLSIAAAPVQDGGSGGGSLGLGLGLLTLLAWRRRP